MSISVQRICIWLSLFFLVCAMPHAAQAERAELAASVGQTVDPANPMALKGELNREKPFLARQIKAANMKPFFLKWVTFIWSISLFFMLLPRTTHVFISVFISQFMKRILLRPLKFTSNYVSFFQIA